MDFFSKLFFWGLYLPCYLVSIPVSGQNSQVDHWEAIITLGDEWSYFPGISEPSSDWNSLNFDDSEWDTGKTGIGYGDEDDSTLIDPVVSLYMRKEFAVVKREQIEQVILYMDYDDAFVAYLNGTEIARANIEGNPPDHNTLSTSLHEALLYRGINPEEFRISTDLLDQLMIAGTNVLAIQVHNHSTGSSDMTSIPYLLAGINDTDQIYREVPDWFTPPVDYSLSELPILKINTYNRSIVDEPRIRAWLSVIDNGQGKINSQYDPVTGYDGWINIEIRGESAQMFPKKSYSFETQDSVGENNNVELLGFPVENDWILYGPYSDKTLLKNVITYQLARDMGRYATRTKYCELFINEEYRGLYVLMEKIKQDKNRVDISKLRDVDTSGDELSGGYILRVDKLDDNDYPAWNTIPASSLHGEDPISFQYFDPDGFELQPTQREYIIEWMKEFETALNSSYYLDPFTGFKAYIDIPSFIDFIIINELTKNIDAYIFSTYMYKEKDSNGGRLHMGPVWDFNISFGNVDYNNSAMMPDGWMFHDNYRMYWFRRMMRDRIFSNHLNCRWHELRSNILSNDRIFSFVDSLVIQLEGPIQKNYKRWPVLGTYIWPNVFIGNTYQEEIEHLKDWISDRLDWMDSRIPVDCVTAIDDNIENKNQLSLYPNPFSEKIIIEKVSGKPIDKVRLYDHQGRLILVEATSDSINSQFRIEWEDERFASLKPGIYIIQVTLDNGDLEFRKLLKR